MLRVCLKCTQELVARCCRSLHPSIRGVFPWACLGNDVVGRSQDTQEPRWFLTAQGRASSLACWGTSILASFSTVHRTNKFVEHLNWITGFTRGKTHQAREFDTSEIYFWLMERAFHICRVSDLKKPTTKRWYAIWAPHFRDPHVTHAPVPIPIVIFIIRATVRCLWPGFWVWEASYLEPRKSESCKWLQKLLCFDRCGGAFCYVFLWCDPYLDLLAFWILRTFKRKGIEQVFWDLFSNPGGKNSAGIKISGENGYEMRVNIFTLTL